MRQVWGITIGSTVLQNELAKALTTSFFSEIPQGALGLYALIPELVTLPPHSTAQVRTAFAHSLGVLWQVLAAVCAVGSVASLFMYGLPLSRALDPTWTISTQTDTDMDKEKGDMDRETAHEMDVDGLVVPQVV